MRTRRTQYTHLEILRSPEIQNQIANDAKLARRIDNRFHSPMKKGNKEGNRKTNNPLERTSKTAATRRLDFGDVKEGQARALAQAQAGGISVMAAVDQSKVHSESEEDSEAKEANEPENWVGEVAPSSISKRLRSLFKTRVDAQVADKVEELEQAPVVPRDISELVGDAGANIAQVIPAHLRQEFSASVVNSIRAQRGQGDGSLRKESVEGVMGVMRDLLRKPHREIPTQRGEAEQRHGVEEIRQMRISHILARALAFIRNGQQSEALRELAKQELKDLSETRTTEEVLELTAKLFPKAKEDELLPTRPDDAPRVLIAPDAAFKTWLGKAVRKIKASGPDGISTQVFRALLMEDEACAFVASMIERIVNADVEKDELSSLSTLLLVLVPKADGGARPVAIANTIVRIAKAYALYLGGDVFTRIFDEEKLQHGAAPAGPERIIHTVKAAFTTDKENTAILCSDISNAYNERHRAKMLSTLYSRPELRHLWRCADLMYASGPTRLITRIDGINVVLETNCTTGAIQGCSIGGNLFNLAITEDLKVIQAEFKELTVFGLHDDITITAHSRQDFGKLMGAAKFMKPVLLGEGSRMNMAKSRFVYYGESELAKEVTDAIREAGVRLVNKDSTTEGADRKYHYIHGIPVGPNKEATARMTMQDVEEKVMNLERIKLLPVQDAMVVLRRTASAALNYITRCGTPEEVRPASTFFDNKVAELVCDIQRLQKSELTAEMIDEILSPLLMGGTGIVATEPVTAAGIPFLASMARALPMHRESYTGGGEGFCIFRTIFKGSQRETSVLEKVLPRVGRNFRSQVR